MSEKIILTAHVYMSPLVTPENVGSSISNMLVSMTGPASTSPHESATVPHIVKVHPVSVVALKFILTPVSDPAPVYVCEILVDAESISSRVAISPTSRVQLKIKFIS